MIVKNIFALAMVSIMPLLSTAAAAAPKDSAELMMACVIGSVISAMYSLRRSRKYKEETSDAAINLVIAVLAGMSAGYFLTKFIAVTDVSWLAWAQAYPPVSGLILSLMGAQLVELVMSGKIVKVIGKKIGVQDQIKIDARDREKVSMSDTGTIKILKVDDHNV